MIYRMGFATSRAEARQLIRHGHFLVDGRKVDIPSYLLRPARLSSSARRAARSPASSRRSNKRAPRRPRLAGSPARRLHGPRQGPADPGRPHDAINEKLVVELYSK